MIFKAGLNYPFSKTLLAYIAGRINGMQRQDVYNHIAKCEDS